VSALGPGHATAPPTGRGSDEGSSVPGSLAAGCVAPDRALLELRPESESPALRQPGPHLLQLLSGARQPPVPHVAIPWLAGPIRRAPGLLYRRQQDERVDQRDLGVVQRHHRDRPQRARPEGLLLRPPQDVDQFARLLLRSRPRRRRHDGLAELPDLGPELRPPTGLRRGRCAGGWPLTPVLHRCIATYPWSLTQPAELLD
jgi:hypothetical protein